MLVSLLPEPNTELSFQCSGYLLRFSAQEFTQCDKCSRINIDIFDSVRFRASRSSPYTSLAGGDDWASTRILTSHSLRWKIICRLIAANQITAIVNGWEGKEQTCGHHSDLSAESGGRHVLSYVLEEI